jgi:hypothetical protein
MQRVKLVIIPQGVVRRMVIQDTLLDTFLKRLEQININLNDYEIRYIDEESDIVTFSTQHEWEVALQMAGSNILKIQLVRKDFKVKSPYKPRRLPLFMKYVLFCITFSILTNLLLVSKMHKIM